MVAKFARWAKQAGEKTFHFHRLNIGPRLTLCFVFIILAMLVGNAVLLWHFHLIRAEAERLRSVDQQLIAVLQAHTSLLSFYERLDKLAHSEDTARLVKEVGPLHKALLEDTQRSRDALSSLPPEVQLDQTILPTFEAIQSILLEQLEAITALAKSRDWEAVRLRLANKVRPLESLTSTLVEKVDREVGEERAQAVLNIGQVQRRILLIVPMTAVLTLLFAALLGLAITRSIAQPLGRLMEASTALARGDFSHRVPARGDDEIARLGSIFNDMIVRLQELYRELQRREGYLAEAQKLSHTGSFGWDVSSGEIYWSGETFRIFEFEPTSKVTIERIVQRIHPEDRLAVQEQMERFSRERTKFDLEHRLLMPDGSVKRLHVVGHPSTDELGRFEFVGAVTDITERKHDEEALRRSEGYLAEAERLTHSGSWAWNVRTLGIFWSQEMFRILGYDHEKVKPTLSHFLERVHPDDRPMIEQWAKAESIQREWVDSGVHYRIILADGTIRNLHSVAHPVMNESGEIVEVVGTSRDVTEQHEARAALETAFEEIKALKDQLYKENIALREEIDKASMFEDIVGESPALLAVLERVAKVAPTDSTVLITGETGTGKELIARAIHKRSQRSARAFVTVNCAATPATLIASELFGHEKGAFTGALQRHLGRFELADGGTIFLDEIGELPADTQIALLRVLQEREFDRVGGSQPIRADVRVIAATNRDLESAIAGGAFRQDLFYRLNVFPIEIPPLRERSEDIPMLIEYFIHRYSRKSGKKLGTIEKKSLELLQSYAWPGNIRELQNVIERSVIVCETDLFSVDPSWLSFEPSSPQQGPRQGRWPTAKMSAAQEREVIERALAATGGRVSGPSGAAAQLGMPASTLESKIRSLKINKFRFKNV